MWTNTDYELAEIADALNIEKEMVGDVMKCKYCENDARQGCSMCQTCQNKAVKVRQLVKECKKLKMVIFGGEGKDGAE